MSKNLFPFPFKQQLSKPSTWLFLLTTILLHIFLLESASWKVSPASSESDIPASVSVYLRPEIVEEAPAPSTPPSVEKAKKSVTTAAPVTKKEAPSLDQQTDTKAEPPPQESSTTETNTTATETPVIAESTANPSDGAAMPEFSLKFPPPAELQMEVSYAKVNDSPTTGVATLTWERDIEKYKISIEVGINLLITKLNLMTITSEGYSAIYGLMPVVSHDIRRTRAATAIHFNHKDKVISFSSSNKSIPMENGAQDAASILMQLAAIGAANKSQLEAGREFSIQVAEGRDATPFLFRVIGEEEIESKLEPETGKLTTIHITRPPKPGFYNSKLDIWLAPSLGWYPVQIRNTESNGTVTNQVVTSIKQNIHYEN